MTSSAKTAAARRRALTADAVRLTDLYISDWRTGEGRSTDFIVTQSHSHMMPTETVTTENTVVITV